MSVTEGLRLGLIAVLAGCACLGCEGAHYVVRGPDNGVVAIPQDTPELRAKAEKLMHRQFPDGYVLDDVRVAYLGRPWETVTRVGPFAEVETHQRHEVMLYYHAGRPAAPLPAPPPGPAVTTAARPPAPQSRPATPDGLPPQPIPVGG